MNDPTFTPVNTKKFTGFVLMFGMTKNEKKMKKMFLFFLPKMSETSKRSLYPAKLSNKCHDQKVACRRRGALKPAKDEESCSRKKCNMV